MFMFVCCMAATWSIACTGAFKVKFYPSFIWTASDLTFNQYEICIKKIGDDRRNYHGYGVVVVLRDRLDVRGRLVVCGRTGQVKLGVRRTGGKRN